MRKLFLDPMLLFLGVFSAVYALAMVMGCTAEKTYTMQEADEIRACFEDCMDKSDPAYGQGENEYLCRKTCFPESFKARQSD